MPTTTDSSVLAQPAVLISSMLCAPSHNQDPIATIKNELRYALDDLEVTGMLQSKNRMYIEALLNPSEESRRMEETTDKEICQAPTWHTMHKKGPSVMRMMTQRTMHH